MTDPTVLLIWADGLSSRYLNELDTPLLSKFAVGSRQATLQSMFGYLSVGGAVFCGLQPGRSRLLWEFGRREAPASVGSALRAVLSVVDHVPNDRARFLLRLGILRSLGTEYLGLANAIPHDLLWYFQPRLSSQLEHRPLTFRAVKLAPWSVDLATATSVFTP